MDSAFWAGILIAAVISIPLSIFANIYTDTVRSFFVRWRGFRLNKQQSRELARFRYVEQLCSGDPVALAALQLDDGLATRNFVFGGVMAMELFFMAVLVERLKASVPSWVVFTFASVTASGAIILILTGWVQGMRVRLTRRRMANIKAYADAIQRKWGPVI